MDTFKQTTTASDDVPVLAAVREAMTRVAETTQRAADLMVTVLGPVLDEMTWHLYRQAGSPYGGTTAGRDRWVEEQSTR